MNQGLENSETVFKKKMKPTVYEVSVCWRANWLMKWKKI